MNEQQTANIWRPTACILCYVNCGLEVATEGRRITRVRAVWVDSNNPANTAADTARFEAAFRALELSVVVDVAYTETAALADYVLPAASQYEKWETTLFSLEWPRNFFHLRAPLFEPLPGMLPEPEIYTRLLRAMGDLPGDEALAELRALATEHRGKMMQRACPLIRLLIRCNCWPDTHARSTSSLTTRHGQRSMMISGTR